MNRQGNVDVSIAAPVWRAAPGHVIDLNGRQGEAIPRRPRNFGDHGRPGVHGGNAGNFFGIGMKFRGANLTVFAHGGDGGPGEDGMAGLEGSKGEEVSDVWCIAQASWTKRDVIIRGALSYGHYCRRTGTKPIKYDDCENNHDVYFLSGPGTPGGNGGHGGKGGAGGFGGKFLLLNVPDVKENSTDSKGRILQAQFEDGSAGEDGMGGVHGRGGMDGQVKRYNIQTESTKEKLLANILTYGITANFPHGVKCRLEKQKTYDSTNRAPDGRDGEAGAVAHMSIPVRPTYSQPANGRLVDILKLSAITLSQSKNCDKNILLQPLLLPFIQSSDDLLSNLTEFSNTFRLFEEYIFLEKSSTENYAFDAGTSVESQIYSSLQTRILKMIQASNTNPSHALPLKLLHTAVLSRLASFNQRLGPLLIVDIKSHLNTMKEDATRFVNTHGLTKKLHAFDASRKAYEEDISGKISEANRILTQNLAQEVGRVVNELQDKQMMLVSEITESAHAVEAKQEASRKKMNVIIGNQLLLKFLMSSLQFGFSTLLPAPASNSITALTTISEKATKLVSGFMGAMQEEYIQAVGGEMEDLNQQLLALQKQKQKVGEYFPEILVTLGGHPEKFTEILKAKSAAGLALSKWEIKSFLSSVKGTIRTELSMGYTKSDQEIIRCFDLMDSLFTIMIEVYDRIQEYNDQKLLANYLAELQEAGSSWLADYSDQMLKRAIVETEMLKAKNLLLLGYKHTMGSFALWAFPFASYLDADFQVPIVKANSTSGLVQNVALSVAEQTRVLERKLSDYYSSIAPFDHIRHWKQFKGSNVESPPAVLTDSFYIWTERDIITGLLKGEKLVLTPKVQRGPAAMDAIKFKTLRLDFKSLDKDREAALVKQLTANFSVSMNHLGGSHFLCSGQVRS